ncbi:MAG: 2-dehydro-3-deoxygluconokinase [Chlamydiae bacterium]|nr:2-dehydro-3-deoxygluconokinase [Chlamydiota bacterium]
MDDEDNYEILGVGAPLLDHLLIVNEEYLNQISGEKYGMETIDYPEMIQIIEGSGTVPKQIAGGSCANAIKGLASLGRKCAMTGKIGRDAIGEKVLENLQDLGVTPLLHYSTTPTAHVTCLITPDGKRTCRSYLGASREMGPSDLQPEHFEGVRLVHIEGYTLLCNGLTQKAMQLAKEKGALVSFDLGSFEIVNDHKNLILVLLEKYVDVVFANEDEIYALTGHHPKEGCSAISTLCKIAVVMIGKDGCWIGHNNTPHQYPSLQVEAIDTTGAGDLFASGFLHGYLAGMPLDACARWGAITGSTVVQIVGAEIPPERWEQIKRELSRNKLKN